MASSPSSPPAQARGGRNPLEEWSGRVKALEAGFRAWMAKQPIHVEAAVTTAVGAVQGGALGGLMGSVTADGGAPWVPPLPPNANPQAMASFKQAQVANPTASSAYFILFPVDELFVMTNSDCVYDWNMFSQNLYVIFACDLSLLIPDL